jgi:glycosyltransferase involved in cell wall biosynthesis
MPKTHLIFRQKRGPATGKLPISATIVARNEEQKIERCLSSLSPLVDEIVFVHDGRCEDTTLEIARQHSCRIFIRDYVGEAEPHRRFAIGQCRNTWILQIDADEYLTGSLQEALPGLIASRSVSGYRFLWNVSYSDVPKRYNMKLALYRKDRIRKFHGIPHEVVAMEGKIQDRKELELGHDRTRTRQKTEHNANEWPRIHGRYLERYKFRRLPSLMLAPGYLMYPILGTGLSLVRGTIAAREIPACFDYHLKLWDSFSKERRKRLKTRTGKTGRVE